MQDERDAVVVEDEAAVSEYAALAATRAEAASAARAVLTQPQHILPFLQPGRLVRVLLAPPDTEDSSPEAPEVEGPGAGHPARLASNGEASTSEPAGAVDAGPGSGSGSGLGREDEGVWAAVVNFERVGSAKAGGGSGGNAPDAQYVVDLLVNCEPDTVPGRGPRRRVQWRCCLMYDTHV